MTKLVRWRVLLSEFRFQIERIPGAQNVVIDGLTRIPRGFQEIKSICAVLLQGGRIFRMDNSEVEFRDTGDNESDDELEVLRA